MTLFDEVGGSPAVKTAVTVFYSRVVADEVLAAWFEGIDLSRLRAHQRAFLAAALGGPELFAGRDLAEAHAGLEITDEAFDQIVHHLVVTLRDLGSPDEVVERVRERLEATRAQIVRA